ncbi:MAG: hypothetical protein COB14_07045 [Alphaproteobacteria bacterium]|nr:MAG: hypothetical protein COB14_07045 [Alphaproteobacteria bacterium]
MILDFGYLCMTFRLNLSDSFDFPCHIHAEKSRTYAGGHATNQAIAAARSGAKVAMIGTIGTDVFGENITKTLRREGISTSGIAKSTTPTGVIHTLINHEHQKATVSSANANLESVAEQLPYNMLNERALILLQNDMATNINIKILKRAKTRKARAIMCFPHDENIEDTLLDNLDIVIIDEKTLPAICEQLSIPLETYTQYFAKEKNVHCIITRNNGQSGAYAISKNQEKYEQRSSPNDTPTSQADIFDSFCGTFTSCIQAGLNLPKAMLYAVSAASLTAENDAFPYLGDIEDNLD